MTIDIFRTRDGQEIAVSVVCDGVDQGCGGGLLLLMLQAMKRLEPGAVLEVRSTDPGVREDLPAWCRMTGNELLAEQEGERRNRYFLRKVCITMSHPSHADRVLDLGEQGCGQLVMELMLAMRALAPGQTLLVTAYDPAAAGDIAAWCRMTGNTLRQILPDSSGRQFLLQKGPNF